MATTFEAKLQFLTGLECSNWASTRGYRLRKPPWRPQVDAAALHGQRFAIPEDAGARVALARMLWESVAAEVPEVLVWVTEWGVWPSGEHPPLAAAVRRGLGETRPLHEAPGAVVSLNEADAGLSLFVVAILFLWDCWLLLPNGQVACYISHDEYGDILTAGDLPSDVLTRLAAFTTLLPLAT